MRRAERCRGRARTQGDRRRTPGRCSRRHSRFSPRPACWTGRLQQRWRTTPRAAGASNVAAASVGEIATAAATLSRFGVMRRARDDERLIQFFLRRPIFASVCSTIIVLAGLVSIPTLPIAQFPKIAPPVVTVHATYTGANAQAVETSVTTPLEEAINGVQGLRYIVSQSSDNGQSRRSRSPSTSIGTWTSRPATCKTPSTKRRPVYPPRSISPASP